MLLGGAAGLLGCVSAQAQTGSQSVILETLSVEGSASGAGGPGRGGAGAETATGPVRGFVAARSATGTKTDTPLIRTPQSISVVTADQIVAQAGPRSRFPSGTGL